MSAILKHKNLKTFTRITQRAKDAQVLTGDEIPVAALEAFYEQMFPARAEFLKRHWRWLYRTDNDTQVKSPIVVMKDNQVAGHVGIIPLSLRRKHDQRTAIWLCDIAVLPQYRGKALGAFLVAEAMALCPLRLGFPNSMSWKLVSKFGWKDQFNTYGLSLFLRPDRHPKIRERAATSRGLDALAGLAGLATRIAWRARTWLKTPLIVSPAKPDQLSAFYETQPAEALHVVRSRDYLNWRISAHPNLEDHFVLSLPQTDSGTCSAIVRIVEDDGCRRLHVLTLQVEPFERQRLSDLCAGIVRWALAENVDVVSAFTNDLNQVQAIRWWLPVLKPLRYAYYADDLAGEEFLAGAGQVWEYIDGDFDLAYTSPNHADQDRSSQCA